MFREDFLVAFICFLLFATGRSKECWEGSHGVVDPLSSVPIEERVVMAVCVENKWLAWDFDVTRGFPGEDIRNLLS